MATIPLRNHAGEVVAEVLVDDADAEELGRYRWRLQSQGYAIRYAGTSREQNHVLLMHRQLLGLERGDTTEVDHRNRNRLDNRRANLRSASRAEQCQNQPSRRGSTSGFRGVSWDRSRQCWRATVTIAGRQVHHSYHADELEAARVASAFRAEHMPFAEDAA